MKALHREIAAEAENRAVPGTLVAYFGEEVSNENTNSYFVDRKYTTRGMTRRVPGYGASYPTNLRREIRPPLATGTAGAS